MQTQTETVVVKSSRLRAPVVVTLKEPLEVVQLNRVNLKSLIQAQNGKFVSVDYVKADGSLRTLTGRLGVKAYLKGGVNTVEAPDRSYLTVFDVKLLEYRTVDLATVSEMRANRRLYRIVD